MARLTPQQEIEWLQQNVDAPDFHTTVSNYAAQYGLNPMQIGTAFQGAGLDVPQQYRGTPQEEQQWVRKYVTQPGGLSQEAAQSVQQYAEMYGLTPQDVSTAFQAGGQATATPEAISKQAYLGDWTPSGWDVQPTIDAILQEQAEQGAGGRVESGLGGMESQLAPWTETGLAAYNQQAALSGALGADAQQAAFDAFVESPEQQYLREQGQREVLAGAAATGGLGGGNVQKELTRFGTALAGQDLANRFSRLGSLSGLGGQAASQLATGRLSTGQNLASQLGGLGVGLSGMQQILGMAGADIYGTGASKIGNWLSGYGGQMGQIPMDVASVLANLATGTGSKVGSYITGAGQAEAAGVQGSADVWVNAFSNLADTLGG